MALREKIQSDLKNSLKAGEKIRTGVLRQLIASIHNLEIDKKAKKQDVNEADILGVIRREAKKRTEAIELFSQGKRDDLVQQEKQELEIIQGYLPQMLPDAEIEKTIDKIIKKEGAASPKDFGRLMGILMKEFQGQADAAKVSDLLKSKLAADAR